MSTTSTVPSESRSRYRRILRFAAGYLVQTWWFEIVLVRLGMRRIAERTRSARTQRVAVRFRAMAIELGGLMIKVGQFLSSRLDVLPPEVTSELATLQDAVPPAPFAQIRALAESELGMSLERAYASFEAEPVAAASLGQAHRARLTTELAADVGFTDVVVKVQRPGIEDVVATDLAALNRVAVWVSRFRTVSARVDAPALVAEFARTCREEVDYLHEAGAAERFAADFAGDDRVSAPVVDWERTTRRVLTLSDVTAIKLDDVEALRAAGINPAAVANALARLMFEQLFTHGFFHADPHPGNLFVTPTAETAGFRITFIDFGMTGESSPVLQAGLRRLLIAAAARDGHGLVAAMDSLGVLLPSADTRELERAMTAVFDRFGGMGFAQLREVDQRELDAFGREFSELLREAPFQLPEDFLLIIRAVSLVSGVCSSLDPRFNVWDAIEPFAGELMRSQGGAALRDFVDDAVANAGALWRLPRRANALLDTVDRGELRVDLGRLDRRVANLESFARRILGGVFFAALLVGGVLLLPTAVVPGIVLMCASAIPGIYALVGGRPGH
ncbi:ABC1 kinase family protein [Microbacterium gorillae]|uniref:ABC1 kinase family protein n=1 Tax=Microbacterium gorillae TaxID=1231063 RepID=UPI00058D486E|nr:AarF/ABC1/UbiB kinase family protein [Microbacterium gorillae]